MNPKRSTIGFLLLLFCSVFVVQGFAAPQGNNQTYLPLLYKAFTGYDLPDEPLLLYASTGRDVLGVDFFLGTVPPTQTFQLTEGYGNYEPNDLIYNPDEVFSPNGQYFVFYKARQDGDDTSAGLWVMEADSSPQIKIDDVSGDQTLSNARWAFDSQTLAYRRGSEVRTFNVTTGVSTTVATDADLFGGIAWDSARLRLYYGSEDQGLMGVNADGTEQTIVLDTDPIVPSLVVLDVLPDGRVLFGMNDGTATELYTIQPDGSARTLITGDILLEGSISVSPDGSKLAFRQSATDRVVIASIEGEVLWQYTFDCAGYGSCASNLYSAWAQDSSEFAFSWSFTNPGQNEYAIYRVATDGSQVDPTLVDQGDNRYRGMAYSPDGRYFAYVGPDTAEPTILVTDRTTGTSSVMVRDEYFLFVHAWQPQP